MGSKNISRGGDPKWVNKYNVCTLVHESIVALLGLVWGGCVPSMCVTLALESKLRTLNVKLSK
jgi:hypothetical protein